MGDKYAQGRGQQLTGISGSANRDILLSRNRTVNCRSLCLSCLEFKRHFAMSRDKWLNLV